MTIGVNAGCQACQTSLTSQQCQTHLKPRDEIPALLARAGDGARARLSAIAELRRELDRIEEHEVANAVRDGMSWSQVGRALGVTRQAAHKKHSERMRAGENGDGERRVAVAAETREAMRCAREEAARLGAPAVGTEHILVGLMRVPGPAADAIASAGATIEMLRDVASPTLERPPVRPDARPPVSALAREVLAAALRQALARGDSGELRPEHLLFAILEDPAGGAARTLDRLGIAAADVRTELEWTRS